MQGYIYLHRKMLENPIICKDTDHIAVWVYLLLNATHTGYDTMFEGARITLQPGQLLTGRKSIAAKLNINESKVQRILKTFETEQQIEQQTTPRNRLISIVNWKSYQYNEQQTEQQLNNKRTTTEQQLNTNNNVNKVEKVKKVKEVKIIYKEFVKMTEIEYNKLIAEYGESFTNKMVDKLDDYKASTGKKYASDYRTILNWIKKDKEKGESNNGKPKGNNGTSSNRGSSSEETIRLERIARETGLLDKNGRCGPIPEVDF